jgi:hypothetical protein
MSSTVTGKDHDPLFFILFAWILVGFTSLFILMGVGTGQVISFSLWIAAVAIVLPPLKRWLIVKLPFLKNRFLKVFCWFVLWVVGLAFLNLPPNVKAIALCAQPQQGVCTDSSAVFPNQSKLYLSGQHTSLKDGTEFTVNLVPDVGLKSKKVKAKVQKETFLLELEPSKLPVGTYKVTLAADTKVSLPEAQEFTVWAGIVDQLKLCDRPEQSACNTETTAFVEDTPTLYLSGTHNNLTEGAEFVANLTYHSEAKKSTTQQLPPIRAKVKDQQVRFEVQPQDLPIGTYDLTLTSKDKIKVNGSKTFTVWRLHEEAKASAENKFPESRLVLEKLSLCDRSKYPVPDKKDAAAPIDDQPIDETKAEKVDGKIVRERRRVNFCEKDSDRFPTTTKAIGFQLDFDPVAESRPLKIVWRMDGEVISNPKVMSIGERTNGLTYTFASREGFPKGKYELLLSLEAKNAKPILRQFTVE